MELGLGLGLGSGLGLGYWGRLGLGSVLGLVDPTPSRHAYLSDAGPPPRML